MAAVNLKTSQGLLESMTSEVNTGPWDSGPTLHLFTNDVTPTIASVAGDFTEAAWASYSAVTLALAGLPFIDGPTVKQLFDTAFFTNANAGDQQVYGWYILSSVSGQVIGVGRFDAAPLTIPEFVGVLPLFPLLVMANP